MIFRRTCLTIALHVTLLLLFCPMHLAAQTCPPPASDTGIYGAADTLNCMTQQNGMQQVVELGLFDGSNPYTFSWALPSQCPEGILQSKCCQPGQSSPSCVPLVPLVNIGNCKKVTYQVLIQHQTPDFQLFVGGQAATVRPDPTNPGRMLATVSPVSALGGPLVIKQGGQGVYTKPMIVNHADVACDLGAFVVPYVLLTIVYEPPGSANMPPDTGSQASYSTTSTIGTTLSWDTLVSKGNVQTVTSQDFFNKLVFPMKALGMVLEPASAGASTVLSVGPDVITALVPDTTTTTVVSQSFASSGGRGWSISNTDAYKTAAHKYPGQGDVFVVMRDLLIVYAVVGNTVYPAPAGYRDIVPIPLYQLAQFFSTAPDFVQQAQALDLIVHPTRPYPNPTTYPAAPAKGQGISTQHVVSNWVPPGHYMSYAGDYACPSGSEVDHEIERSEINTQEVSQTTTHTLVEKVTGPIAEISGQAGEQSWTTSYSSSVSQWQGQAIAAGLKLFCPDYPPYGIWVSTYFDPLFGTFVPFVGEPLTNDSQVSGMGAPANQLVTLNISGKRYDVLSKADGTFSFPVKSLPKGSGWVTAGLAKIAITYEGTPLTHLNLKTGAAGISAANLGNVLSPVAPCCPITSIDAAIGVVTAKVNSTGQSFQFTVKDSALLHSLKIGQGVFANFKTHQVSVNGKDVCCQIVSSAIVTAGAGSPATRGTPPNQVPAGQPRPGGACCQITAINQQTGIVTGKVNATGQTFEFKASPPALPSLRIGEALYANLTKRQVSLDGKTMCCVIVAVSQTPPRSGAPPAPR